MATGIEATAKSALLSRRILWPADLGHASIDDISMMLDEL